MNKKELYRVEIIASILNKQITQSTAANRLKISVRQVKRLLRRYRGFGASGLVSKHRGKPSNHAICSDIREQAVNIINANYHDFSPTFAHEKLTELHDFHFSVETLRKWMILDGIWQPKSRNKVKVHQSRPRRSCTGDLIQIDGSPHDWFEGRAPKCTLIVFIDDATSCLMALKFSPSETTQAYMETLNEYLEQYGRPCAIYSDKHSIFRVNHANQETEITQFVRALKAFDISPIFANTPQAKGRVERANQTLQDRLVKEMRLLGISDINAANQYVSTFMKKHNQRFAISPKDSNDAHRVLLHSQEERALIFSMHHTRKLTKNLTFKFKNTEFQLQNCQRGNRLKHAQIRVCEHFDSSVSILHEGKVLDYKILAEGEIIIPIIDPKILNLSIDKIKEIQSTSLTQKPAIDHPWRKSFKARTTA